MQRFEQTPRPTAAVVVWHREETRWVRCTARRTQASGPRFTASGLAAKSRGKCARFNLSWYSVFHNVTDRCCCCCYWTAVESTSTYPRRGGCRVRFSWPLGLSPHQPTGVWTRRDAPTATGRRARSNVAIQLCDHPAHRSFCCCLLSWMTS